MSREWIGLSLFFLPQILFAETLSTSPVRETASGAIESRNPFQIAVFVDEDPRSRAEAEKFIAYFKGTEPFSRMGSQLNLTIVSLPTAKLNCRNTDPSSPRIVECDSEYVAKQAALAGAHRGVVFTSKGTGGSGGQFAVASVGGEWGREMMLHELLHTFDLDDEYPHPTQEEAKIYCKIGKKSPNSAYFKPVMDAYPSNAKARQLHHKDIPWFGSIAPTTRIISGGPLGTPPDTYPDRSVALYPSDKCKEVKNVPSWKPLKVTTIMGTLSAKDPIPPFYVDYLVKTMSAVRGTRIELKVPSVEIREAAVGDSVSEGQAGAASGD